MDRRTALRTIGCATTALLAGCTGSGSEPSDGDGPTETGGTTPTRSPSPTPTDTQYRVTSQSFTVVSNECGPTDGELTGSIAPDPPAPDAREHTVTISGTITGSDTCHTARLAGLTLGESGAELTVEVESYVPEENQEDACSQCLVAIEYELTLTTAGGRPGAVVVTLDGERAGRVDLPE